MPKALKPIKHVKYYNKTNIIIKYLVTDFVETSYIGRLAPEEFVPLTPKVNGKYYIVFLVFNLHYIFRTEDFNKLTKIYQAL